MTSTQFDPVSASVKRSSRRQSKSPTATTIAAETGTSEDGEDCAPSGLNASESALREKGRSHMAAILQTTPDGKAATPRPGPCPDITLLPGARQHLDGVSKIGVLDLYQRPLAGARLTQAGTVKGAEVAVAFPTKGDAASRIANQSIAAQGGRASARQRPEERKRIVKYHGVSDRMAVSWLPPWP